MKIEIIIVINHSKNSKTDSNNSKKWNGSNKRALITRIRDKSKNINSHSNSINGLRSGLKLVRRGDFEKPCR